MIYIITALEGLITFISPCLLPMLPVYLSYLAGSYSVSDNANAKKAGTVKNALGFILGFTITFIILGAFAGSIGMLLGRHQMIVNIACGAVVIIFGLSFLDIIHLNIFKGFRMEQPSDSMHFLSSVLFGLIFSVGWTPCVGAFLGSALMLASQQGSVFKGILLLLCYSLGLGIPFLFSAILIQELQNTIQWIKRHYRIINRVCGILLICIGLAMMTGWMNRLILMLA